jgi:hypothetical protein
MPKKGKAKSKSFPIRSTGGETGAKIGDYYGNMLEDQYNMHKHNVGLARGGYPSAGIGQQIEDKISNWWNNWFGSLARGGAAKQPTPAQIKKGMALFKKEMPMPAAGVGQQIEDKISNWWNNWFGSLARGGSAMARGGMARGGVSVFR